MQAPIVTAPSRPVSSRARLRAVALLLLGAGTTDCRPRTPSPRNAPARRADASGEPEAFRVPVHLPPGVASPDGREIDAPLAWLFPLEAPVLTGSAPTVIAAAELPCGYRATYGDVHRSDGALRVRMRARFQGDGTPPDASQPCRPVNLAVEYISLGRVRRGTYRVSDHRGAPALVDAASGPVADGALGFFDLPVVADDANAPVAAARRQRACTPGHDDTCIAGACGALPSNPARGVCVPPLDPYLVVGRPCPGANARGAGTVEVALAHDGPFAMSAAPAPGALRACLPACDAAHPCEGPLECVNVGAASACVPR